MKKSTKPMLQLALGIWIFATLCTITVYGSIIGIPLAFIALWPFGLSLRREFNLTIPRLVIVLVTTGIILVALSIGFVNLMQGFPG